MKLSLRSVVIPLALAAAVTASASGITLIRVHSGDTLSAIAARYHTTVSRLVTLNDLPGNGNLIYAGQTLRIPTTRHHEHHATHGAKRHVTHGAKRHLVISWHTVVEGDTVDGLAARFHTTRRRIARRNHLPASLVIVLGQRLAIPHRGSGHSTTVTGSIVRERNYLQHRREPSRAAMAELIRRISSRWHVDPSLALAIAWQESGFNMREVSPVGAIGTMQVMPYTGAYISDAVVHRKLNLFDASDNVTAGVALLSVLTHTASSDRQAIAGYYQGLQSVRDHGMYLATRQYVANVTALRRTF